jgi:hypothetical protein
VSERPILIIVSDTTSPELTDLKDQHRFGMTARVIGQNIEGLETGGIPDLFIALRYVNQLGIKLSSTTFRLMIYERTIMEQLEAITLSSIQILAIWKEFQQLKTIANAYWRLAFNCPQFPAFDEAFRDYAHHRFILMSKINKNRQINFQFLHMESADRDIYDFVRNELEENPCEHCGAIKIKGAFSSCCARYKNDM